MKKLKFKSLAMRIWTTFTIIILIIICSISVLYMVAYRKIEEKAKIQDLTAAHEMLLRYSDYSNPISGFGGMKNLKGSNYFIVNIYNNKTTIIDMHDKMNDKINNNIISSGSTLPANIQQGPPPIDHYNDTVIKKWMAGFVKNSTVHEQQFKDVYNNTTYLFIISSIDYGTTGKFYLISYMPDLEDNSILYAILGIGIIFIAIGFLTAEVVAGRLSKPLKELEDYTVRIAHKDWKEPIEVKSNDEIGRLANSMNHMRKELKRADEEEKMFLQSISHDLKTPVMVIMSHADAIIDGVYIDSVEKTAEIIRDEALSLEKKIKQMLYLDTLDYVLENNSENSDIDMKEFILHIINRFELVNSKIEWDLDMDELIITGNSDKLQVAIENVLDNGLRYAEKKIRISLKKEGYYAVLDIFNDGPNIKNEHINHIFKNLYKDKTGNFGLGLAITKKIIDFYKGDIKAVNRENGVSFIIKLPINDGKM